MISAVLLPTFNYRRDTLVFRDAVLSILATIAKQERIRLSERTWPAWSGRGSKGG